ncbi:hypothetical protein [Sinomonas sp. G460-2]|uniref:hypothetical protein n=1 Tax=Sinomonas sp. G460-2 TaxID=3393464 RepID=UPI0039F0416B
MSQHSTLRTGASRRAVTVGLFVGALIVMGVTAGFAGSFLKIYGSLTSGALQALSFGWISLVIALPLVWGGVWAANRARWALIAGAAILVCGIAAIAIAGEIGVNAKRADSLVLPPWVFNTPECAEVLRSFTPPVPYASGAGEQITGAVANCQIGLDPTGTGLQAVLASYRRQMQDKGWQVVNESGSTITGTHDGVTLLVDGSGTLIWLRLTAPAAGKG